ncbi:MAG: hypothetical protein V2A76_16345 [Planctomycetota bacterium]
MEYRLVLLSLGLLFGLAPLSSAQPNQEPGKDVSLGILGGIYRMGRTGSYPNGVCGLALSTTSCNVGSIDLPWLAPMGADHPFIGFLVVRDEGGRMVQVSDRSFVKHGYYALSSSQCSQCLHPSNGTFLGVGCSDTYGTGSNGDDYYLGPAEEVNPWTGTWDPVCSHFDRGEPVAPPPYDCDGNRSAIIPSDPLGHIIHVKDSDFQPAGTYYFSAQYVLRGEPDNVRENNQGSRYFTRTWTGSSWSIGVPSEGSGNVKVEGSVLNRWSGATVTSTTNGPFDGRVYLAIKTTDLGGGIFHYEYALHNRDNARGIGSFSIPVCPGAAVTNESFRDVDSNAGNDWTVSRTATDLVFSTTSNPLGWNSIFNFSFDAAAPPGGNVSALLEQFDAGPGFDQFQLATLAPMGATNQVDLGYATLGADGLYSELRSCGDLSSSGNGQLVLRFAQPNALSYLLFSLTSTPTPFWDSVLVPYPIQLYVPLYTSANGTLNFPVPGGRGPVDVWVQYLSADATSPHGYAFSNGLKVFLEP